MIKSNNTRTNEQSEHQPNSTDFLPKKFYENLPEILSYLQSQVKSDRHKDILLFSYIGILSGCFPNCRIIVDGREYSLGLHIAIIGPSSSGKGWVNKSYSAIKESINLYEQKPSLTTPSMTSGMLTSLNMSEARLFSLLKTHKNLILVNNELDDLSNILRTRHGFQLLSTLRQVMENESVTKARDTKDESIDFPMIAFVLAGTPDQAHIFRNNLSNGFYNRIIPYFYKDREEFIPSSERRVENQFNDLGKYNQQVANLIEKYNAERIEFTTSIEAQLFLDTKLDEIERSALESDDDFEISEANRLRKHIIKFACTLSILEDAPITEGKVELTPNSIKVSYDMVTSLKRSGRKMLQDKQSKNINALPCYDRVKDLIKTINTSFDNKLIHSKMTNAYSLRAIQKVTKRLIEETFIKRDTEAGMFILNK